MNTKNVIDERCIHISLYMYVYIDEYEYIHVYIFICKYTFECIMLGVELIVNHTTS
jgi:hypothetical protein